MTEIKYVGGVAIETDKIMEERNPVDFYPTDQELIDAFVTRYDFNMDKNRIVADLGAGDGRWGLAVKKKYSDSILLGTDIRDLPQPENFDFWYTGETGSIYNIQNLPITNFGLILGNPPYSMLNDWVDICLDHVSRTDGQIHLLLSLNWLAGERRYKKYYSNGLVPDITVCSTRPSFRDGFKGSYPGREFAIFSWRFIKGFCMTSGQLSWLTYARDRNRK